MVINESRDLVLTLFRFVLFLGPLLQLVHYLSLSFLLCPLPVNVFDHLVRQTTADGQERQQQSEHCKSSANAYQQRKGHGLLVHQPPDKINSTGFSAAALA